MAKTPTPAQLRRQLLTDMAPSVRQQSMGWVQWDTMSDFLGQPFDSTHIPLHKLRQMRRDPMIAFALQFVKLPLVRAPWFIECEDAKIAQFMTEALRLIYERLMLQFALKYDYGYQAIVKNFTTAPVDWVYSDVKSPTDTTTAPVWTSTADPVLWKPFTSVPPDKVMPEWTDSGEFDGFIRTFTAVPGAKTNETKGRVDVQHALWATNEKDSKNGSIWGYPRIGYCNPAEAPITMGDYTQKPISEVQAGDEIIGWERKFGRKASGLYEPRNSLTKATVKNVMVRTEKIVKVTFESGRTLRCTPDHLWLRHNDGKEFIEAKTGRVLSRVVDLTHSLTNYSDLNEDQKVAANWLGGIYDGEGSGQYIAQYKTNQIVRDRIEESLELLEFEFTTSDESVWIKGGRDELMRFARLARPSRLHALDRVILGARFRTPEKIVSVEDDGESEVFALETTTGNYIAWGIASKNSYRYWWSYWYNWALRDRHMERVADPAVVVRYPNWRVMDDETGEVTNLRIVAEMLGEDLRSGCTVSLPSDMIQDADGKPSQTPEWNISYLEQSGKANQEFQSLFDYLDIMKLRSCLVPEQALINGQGAQSNRNSQEQLADFFVESQATEMVEFGDMVNRYMIPQLVSVNFPEYKGKCRWISRGFASADKNLILQILTLIGQSNPDSLQVNVRELMEQLQVPLKTPEQLAAEKLQEQKDQSDQMKMQQDSAIAIAKAQPGPAAGPKGAQRGPTNTQPSVTKTRATATRLEEIDAISGQRAGIDEDGLYYDPRERIVLSRHVPSPFAHKIQDLRYFKGNDKALQAAHDIYEAWLAAFTDYYQNASKHIASRLVMLDESTGVNENAADHLANQTLNAADKLFRQALEDTRDAMFKLAAWAAEREMKELNLDIDWTVENPDIENWMRLHGAQLVRQVTDSTRRELRKFIADELGSDHGPEMIAREIEKKFSQWPDWKADRLARSEARDAYNAGTLLAAQKAGLTHAQASDASGGTNLHTDQECIDRNGNIYTLPKALNIQDHPNGTLAWTPLPPNYQFSEETPETKEEPVDNKRLKEALKLAREVNWEQVNDLWKTTLPKAEITSNSSSKPSITVSARLLYLTSELEDSVKINLHLEPHPEGVLVFKEQEGETTFYDAEDKFANGAKLPQKIFLEALDKS